MAKNLVNGTNVVIEENGDNINMNLSPAYNTNLQQKINDSFKENNTYSTDETIIGTWINGKPIYRKVLDVGSKSFSSGDNYIAHGINNFERAIDLKYTMFFGNNNYVLWDKLLTLQATSTNIIASTTGSNSFTQVYFILEYTKTTD